MAVQGVREDGVADEPVPIGRSKHMGPLMVTRIARELESMNGLLTYEEHWLQRQPRTDHRAEEFRRIAFYRGVISDAVARLGTE